MHPALLIWGLALLAYVGFRAWYDNWRGPLRPEEIEGYLERFEATGGSLVNEAAAIRRFLEEDDGREFIMLNLVRLYPDKVPHPETGEATRARALMQEYLSGFLPALLARGGVPMMQARKVGPYVDSWGVEADPGWTLMGSMRYRSRRDMMELATDPRFTEKHPFKVAAIPTTFSFPTRPGTGALLGPRIWVALVLALLAALAQIASS